MSDGAPRVIRRMPDGTVKQVGPLTGTRVWTVPGRANRPLATPPEHARALAPGEEGRLCAFCSDRYLETTPEKARLVREGDTWAVLDEIPAGRLDATTPDQDSVPLRGPAEPPALPGTLVDVELARHERIVAEALGGRFVYAIIPEGGVDEVVRLQARRKAEARIRRASSHMALESQSLSAQQTRQKIDDLTEELLREMPPDFWEVK